MIKSRTPAKRLLAGSLLYFDRVSGMKRVAAFFGVYAVAVVIASTTGGCEVVALVSAELDDGYPPPPVYLDPCPSVYSNPSASNGQATYAIVLTSAYGIDPSSLIAKDEDLELLFASTTPYTGEDEAGAVASGSLAVDEVSACQGNELRALVDLSTESTGLGTVGVFIGQTYAGTFGFEVAEPASMDLTYEVSGQIRAHVRDEAARDLFVDSSVVWEAVPNGFPAGFPNHGLFAPPIASSAPEITVIATRGPLSATIRLRYDENTGYYSPVPD